MLESQIKLPILYRRNTNYQNPKKIMDNTQEDIDICRVRITVMCSALTSKKYSISDTEIIYYIYIFRDR